MIVCVFCKSEIIRSFKEWNYKKGYYHVKAYKCPNCGRAFNAYFHGDEFSHTIPQQALRKNILAFLRKHTEATLEDMAKSLGVGQSEVLSELIELEKNGRVRSLQ